MTTRTALTIEDYEALVAELQAQNSSMRAGFSAYAKTVRHHSLMLARMETEYSKLKESTAEKDSSAREMEKKLINMGEVNGDLQEQLALLTAKVDVLTEENAAARARIQMTEEEKFEIDKEFLKAARAGKLRDVKVLLSKGADLQARDQDNWTPLIYAACRGHLPVVEVLLSRGAAANSGTKTGSTALMKATKRNHLSIVEVLIAKGANVDLKTDKNATALMLAASFGNLSIVEALLAAGARSDIKTNEGKRALEYAREEGHSAVVQILEVEDARE